MSRLTVYCDESGTGRKNRVAAVCGYIGQVSEWRRFEQEWTRVLMKQPYRVKMMHLKLILLFRSVPNDDIKLRELLESFGLIERFTPYVTGGRGALRGDEAREWLERRRNEAIAEATLLVSTLAMIAAIFAAVRR